MEKVQFRVIRHEGRLWSVSHVDFASEPLVVHARLITGCRYDRDTGAVVQIAVSDKVRARVVGGKFETRSLSREEFPPRKVQRRVRPRIARAS